MTSPLPPSFDFTVKPEHIIVEHRCNNTKCVMAAACLAGLPEGYDLEPSFGSVDLIFRPLGDEWHETPVSLDLDVTAQEIIYNFDTVGRMNDLRQLIGDGLTFTVDTEQMIVRKKEG